MPESRNLGCHVRILSMQPQPYTLFPVLHYVPLKYDPLKKHFSVLSPLYIITQEALGGMESTGVLQLKYLGLYICSEILSSFLNPSEPQFPEQ